MVSNTTVQQEPLLLRATEVADLLNVGRSKVYEMMASGELPVVRFGRCVRIPAAELSRWIDERTSECPST